MTARRAETRDIPIILNMFMMLINYQKSRGLGKFTDDPNNLVGGIMEFIVAKSMRADSLVLVCEDDDGKVIGFLIGGLLSFPGFYQDKLAAEIEWIYPMSHQVFSLVTAFDEWGKQRGATSRMAMAPAAMKNIAEIYERNKLILTYNVFVGEMP